MTRRLPLLVGAALVLSACATTSAAPATTVPASTTSATPTTRATTSTSSSTTTTTTLLLPVPLPAPDPRADEPAIILGSIEIPAIDVVRYLYQGVSLTTLDRGPGHWPGTALPGGYGNAVVGGHRTSHDKPFRYLDLLKPGDEIIYTTVDGRFVYEVTETIIVKPEDIWVIEQKPGYTTTLFACHPVGSTRERIIVLGTLKDA